MTNISTFQCQGSSHKSTQFDQQRLILFSQIIDDEHIEMMRYDAY